nr:hypothetical protein [Tanacetum cinerariifolium]
AKPTVTADKGNKGIPRDNIDDKGYGDSGCSSHGRGKITGKGQ